MRSRQQYSTIREDGAESLLGLNEIAGLPKYHYISAPAFPFPEFGIGEI